MKKLFIIPLVIMFLMSCCHTYQKGGAVRPEYRNIYYSSVTIVARDIKGGGSGTIIWSKKGEKMKILTAAHVVVDLRGKWLEMVLTTDYDKDFQIQASLAYSNKLKVLKVVKVDKEDDLAILEGVEDEVADGAYVKVSNDFPNIGDPIWVIGSPLMEEGTLTTGVISNMNRADPQRKLYRISAPIFFGNSGGGVFNANMELVGVANSIHIIVFMVTVPGAGYCVSLERIRKFL